MKYVIALFVPPLAVLLCGKLGQFLVNLTLWVLGIFGLMLFGLGIILIVAAVIHAFAVIGGHHADKRTNRMIAAMKGA